MSKKKQEIYSPKNSLRPIFKSITLFAFCPKIMTKTGIKDEVRNREILFGLFLIESINLLIMFFKNPVFGEKTLIFAILFAIIGTYFWGNIYALVLYILDKSLIKKLSNYRTCLKLVLLFVIVDVLGGTVYAIATLMGLELGTIFTYIFDLLTTIYAITIFTYYLNKIYMYNTIQTILVDIVYVIISITPKVLNYLLF